MAHIEPTPADVKLDFPLFADVADGIIQRRLDRTPMWVDVGWLESDYTYAKELLAAHWLTLEGFGKGTDSELGAAGLSNVSRLKSGTLDVTFKDTSSAGSSEFDGTSYGKQFASLLRKNRGGPRIAGSGCGYGDQATDYPYAWRTGGFGL